MANRISYNPAGYVDVIIEGEQSYMTFANLMSEALDLLEQLQDEGKKRYGLMDITKQANYTADTNKAAMEMLESITYDKLAIFGGGLVLTEVAKAIVLAMGKGSNTKIYKTKEQALEWLLEDEKKASPANA